LSPDLATAIREETPVAPAALRERVALTAAIPPPAPRWTLRRLVTLSAPVAVGASLAVALAVGLNGAISGAPKDESAGSSATRTLAPLPASRDAREGHRAAQEKVGTVARAPSRLRAATPSRAPAPSGRRAQDYNAALRILVDDASGLSGATQRALRQTRRLGGYVLSVQYGTSEPKEGTATIRVRIPVTRVQSAIVGLSGLGQILAQDVRISDLQQPLDELTRRIRRLERRAANARGAELARINREIALLRRQRAEINRRAAFATVSLDLTTHEPEKKATPPGRLDRAIDDATGVLTAELAIGTYALIVASPILVLLAAWFAGSRAYRRYADQRLLERA
jgi:hypothetical protein